MRDRRESVAMVATQSDSLRMLKHWQFIAERAQQVHVDPAQLVRQGETNCKNPPVEGGLP